MKALTNFPRVERCPDDPSAIKLTSTGYIRNGVHVRTVPRASDPVPVTRRWWWGR